MMAATIPTATIGVQIGRCCSPALSESSSSVYHDFGEDDELLAPSNPKSSIQGRVSSVSPPPAVLLVNGDETSNPTTPTKSTTKTTTWEAPSTPPATPATAPHGNYFGDNGDLPKLVAKDSEQGSCINLTFTPPSTPSSCLLPSLCLTAQDFVALPSSSSERSISSYLTSSDDGTETPLTEPCRSPTIELHMHQLNTESYKQALEKLPCLQCHLASLPCSLAKPPTTRRNALVPSKKLCCTRCVRNGEDFCIMQVATEAKVNVDAQTYTRGSQRTKKIECQRTYFAEDMGREGKVVLQRAEEMLEAQRAKEIFGLPRPSLWKLEKLKPGFGWLVNGSREQWRITNGVGEESWGCESLSLRTREDGS